MVVTSVRPTARISGHASDSVPTNADMSEAPHVRRVVRAARKHPLLDWAVQVRRHESVVRPPSTAKVWPVINVDSFDSRKRDAFATSHAVPRRPSGTGMLSLPGACSGHCRDRCPCRSCPSITIFALTASSFRAIAVARTNAESPAFDAS